MLGEGLVHYGVMSGVSWGTNQQQAGCCIAVGNQNCHNRNLHAPLWNVEYEV
jgi:hypothetical protein